MYFQAIKNQDRFVQVFNDADGFPTLAAMVRELSLAPKTIANRAGILRRMKAKGENVPELDRRKLKYTIDSFLENEGVISSVEAIDTPADETVTPSPSPQEHAGNRARRLQTELRNLIRGSRYPIVNPEAIVVDSYIAQSYSRAAAEYRERDMAPRTWLSDTLRAAPIENPRGRKFLFTGAQNDAALDHAFWRNLKAYAHHINAEIVVGVWTYETQWWKENNPVARAYAPELSEYLCFGQMAIGDEFVFCGDVNILPTAKRPLEGLRTHSRGRWAVFPHSRLQLLSIPSTDPARQAVQIMTTGSVTKPKVIPRLAGAKSIFHHVIGATLVEFDADGDLFCRQINADKNGSFYDLDSFVDDGVVTKSIGVTSLVAADLHIAKLGSRNCEAVFGFNLKTGKRCRGSMLEVLRPSYLFIHDGHDQEIGNHHRVGDGHFNFRLALRNRTSIRQEIERLGDFYVRLKRPGMTIVNVESNHDLALNRYIKEGRYRNDGVNAMFGVRAETAMLEHEADIAAALDCEQPLPHFSLLEWALRDQFEDALDHVAWTYDGGSYKVDGIECGHHGFRGANGSQGTVNGFAEMGAKMSIGDKHSPAILDGVYVAGAMELQHGYNLGPSGWAVTQIIQYPNGKRTLVTLQAGKWRA